jgi:hypothetical protein
MILFFLTVFLLGIASVLVISTTYAVLYLIGGGTLPLMAL